AGAALSEVRRMEAGEPFSERAGRAPGLWRGVTPLALLAVFAWNVYRARAPPVTCDEAPTYPWDLRPGPPTIPSGRRLEPNNHILHTLLVWADVQLFGLSQLSLRLVSLAGGLVYLVAARRLCLLLCGPRALALLGFLLLTLNPLVLDFLVAARGYGLGL